MVCERAMHRDPSSQGDGDAMAEESSDELHPDRTYLASKPLSPAATAAAAASLPVLSPAGQPGSSHLLLANENMYIFFRFHRCDT